MQKRANTVGPKLVTLERPAFKVGLWLTSGNLNFRSVLYSLTDQMNYCVPRVFVQCGSF